MKNGKGIKGNKETTISLQFRTLRSAYNKAIEEKAASKNDYPLMISRSENLKQKQGREPYPRMM